MLYNTSKSVIDAISKIVNEDRKKYNEERDSFESKLQLEAMKKMKYEYIVPEDIEKEGVAHFMGAAAAAHKAGQKKFNFGGKVYPVQIKPHIAHQVNNESVTPKDNQIDEISKKTLGSYISRASVDMANRTADGERIRTLGRADYAQNIRRGMSPKNAEADLKKDYAAAKPSVMRSIKRLTGIDRAVGRLTKEETEEVEEGTYKPEVEKAFPASGVKTGASAPKGTSTMPKDKEKAKGQPAGALRKEEVEEIDEYTGLQKLARKFIPGQGQKQAGERAKDQKYSAGLDRAALKYHPDDKKLATTMKSSEKAQKRYERISRGEAPFKSSPNDTGVKEEAEQIDEYTRLQKLARKFIPGQGQKQAGERAKDQGYSASLDREALKYHPDDKKLATTMKSSEKAQQRYKRISRGEAPFKSSPNDTGVKEEVEPIDELSKATLASYAKKAVSDARFKQGIGKDYEALGKRKRDPETKAMFARMGRKVRLKALSRDQGAAKAIDRLAKEEVEIEEAKDTPGQNHQCALHVKSEQFGEGKTLFSQHAEPDEKGMIAWYDVMFEHGIEKQVPTFELEILMSEAHMNHSKRKMNEEVDIDEGRGRPRKAGSPMMKKSDDEDDEYGPDTGPEPDQNIVNHLKKSVDTGGTHDVKFADGSSHKIPSQVAHKVLGAMGKLKPSDRLEIQKHIHASHKNLMDVHRMIK